MMVQTGRKIGVESCTKEPMASQSGEHVSDQKITGLSRKFRASKLNQKCVTGLNQNLDALVFWLHNDKMNGLLCKRVGTL